MTESPPNLSAERDAKSHGIEFTDLREGRCKFPLGGINDPPERFCGEPTMAGMPYCSSCQLKAYHRPAPRR